MARSGARTTLLVLSAGAVGYAAPSTTSIDPRLHAMTEAYMNKVTPVLTVDAIEPALPFWEALGFARTAEVPGDDGLVFVSLQKDDVELMYQTWSSLEAADAENFAKMPRGPAFLFIEVGDLDAIEAALSAVQPLKPRQTTFYGADEVVFREPGGNIITFAEFAEAG